MAEKLTGIQFRAARALTRLTQADLGKLAGLSLETVKRVESLNGEVKAEAETISSLRRAIESEGVEFLFDETGIGNGARFSTSKGRLAAAKLATRIGLEIRELLFAEIEKDDNLLSKGDDFSAFVIRERIIPKLADMIPSIIADEAEKKD